MVCCSFVALITDLSDDYMEIFLVLAGILAGFGGMFVAETKHKSKSAGFIIGMLACMLVIAVLAQFKVFDSRPISSGTESLPSPSEVVESKVELESNTHVQTSSGEQFEQRAIREFLAKELELDDKLQRGNDEVANAGAEFDYGVPLPYIIKAELTFEKVLEESNALIAPSGAERVKTELIEATNYALSGVRKIRQGLESYPVDSAKVEQGIGLYTKAQIHLARKNAAIADLKQKMGI